MSGIREALDRISDLLLNSAALHRRLEYFVALYFLVFAAGAFLGRAEPLANVAFAGQFAKYSYLGSGFFLLILLSLRTLDMSLRNVFKDVLFWLFFAWVTLSLTFSAHPGSNAKLYIFFLLATAAGLYISQRFNLEEQRSLIEQTVLVTLCLSLVSCLFLPDYGITVLGSKEALAHKGEWRGIFPHKNFLGRMASLGFLLFALRALFSPGRRLQAILPLALCGLLLFYSHSTSSIVVAGLMLLSIPIVRGIRMGSVPAAIAVILIVPPLAYGLVEITTNFAHTMAQLGKTASLSGRIPLWLDCISFVEKKPWLGYGFGGFWPRPDDPASLSNPGHLVWRRQGWHAPNAHNGMLELILTVGFLGFGLYMLGYLKNLWAGIGQVRQGAEMGVSWERSSWDVFILIFLILSNLAEASFLQHFVWIVYIMTATRSRA